MNYVADHRSYLAISNGGIWMRLPKKYLFLTLAALSLTAGYVFWNGSSADLTFRPVSYPQGFRELEIESTYSSSRIDPIFGVKLDIAKNPSRPTVSNICKRLYQDSMSPLYGDANAKITIVEFFDYKCPYCKKLATALKQLQENDDRVRVIYKE